MFQGSSVLGVCLPGFVRGRRVRLLLCCVWCSCSRLCIEISIPPTVFCTSGRRLMTFHVLRPSRCLNICILSLLRRLQFILRHMLYMLPSCSSNHRARRCISVQSVYLSPPHILALVTWQMLSHRNKYQRSCTPAHAHNVAPVHLWRRCKGSYHPCNHITRQTSFIIFLFDLIYSAFIC